MARFPRSSPTSSPPRTGCARRFARSGSRLLIATALHSIATGNLLPAWVKVVCVDINPATVTKLSDRGTFQTIGLVTDVEPFVRSLSIELSSNPEHSAS